MSFPLIIISILAVFLLGTVLFVKVIAPWWRRRKFALPKGAEQAGESTEEMIDRLVDQRKTRKQEKRLNYSYAEDDPFFFISGGEVWVGIVPESTQDSFRTASEQMAIVGHLNDLYSGILQFMQHRGPLPRDSAVPAGQRRPLGAAVHAASLEPLRPVSGSGRRRCSAPYRRFHPGATTDDHGPHRLDQG